MFAPSKMSALLHTGWHLKKQDPRFPIQKGGPGGPWELGHPASTQHNSATITSRGPCTPTVSVISISAVRLGPVTRARLLALPSRLAARGPSAASHDAQLG